MFVGVRKPEITSRCATEAGARQPEEAVYGFYDGLPFLPSRRRLLPPPGRIGPPAADPRAARP